MKQYTDSELVRELRSRGYEVFDKDYATEYLWTLDDAIDTYHDVKKANFTEDELSHEKLMEILNGTVSSSYIMEAIGEKLYQNIYENLFEY
jgi:hypothetical protein